MRVLSVEEVRKLESSLPGTINAGYWHESMRLVLVSLQDLGLLDVHEDQDFVRSTTTPRGQLALRVHRAYLESVGAGR